MTEAAASHSGPYTAEELKAMKSVRRPYSEGMPFGILVAGFLEPLDKIKRSSSQRTGPPTKRKNPMSSDEQREALIGRLIKETSRRGADPYPVIRLTIPELDIEAGPSNIKEKTMAKILPRAFSFHGKTSADRIRLAEWGPEVKDEDGLHVPFIDICRDVIDKRTERTSSTMTVDQVCRLLDQLRLETKEDRRVEVFGELSSALTAGELTWVVRVILDDVHLGVRSTFLRTWHDGAEELMMSRSCLRMVCWKLDGADEAMGAGELGVQLSSCFQPQLASRQVTGTDGTLQNLLQKTLDRLKLDEGERFQIEEKLDGERMQVHIHVDQDGKVRYRWWSRQGVDYTHKYGSNRWEGTLARYISGALALSPEGSPPLESLVLDGEMVVWDSESGAVLPHLSHQPAANHGATIWPLFRAFDALLFNGFTVTTSPLADRHMIMSKYIVGAKQRFEWHRGTSATTVDDLKAAFADAMLEGREGLVVKSLSSPYEPGARPSSWMKLKPEYSSDYDNPLDCVIIGRSFGTGQNAGKLTRLLCGVREGGGSGRWLSFCGLGSGISIRVRDEIEMRTSGKWKSWGDGAEASKFIVLGRSGHETPDQWIVPDQSIVVSVKASAINQSHMYASGTGLLHPRLDQLPALSPAQALSMADVDAIESVRVIRNLAAASIKPVRRPTSGSFVTLAGQPSVSAMATQAETDLFAGKSFFIGADCDDPELSKDEMVVIVRKNGGDVFYKPAEPDYAISSVRTVYILSRIRAGKDDIIHPKWLVDCVKEQRIIELEESHYTKWDLASSTKVNDSSDDDDDNSFEPVKHTR